MRQSVGVKSENIMHLLDCGRAESQVGSTALGYK